MSSITDTQNVSLHQAPNARGPALVSERSADLYDVWQKIFQHAVQQGELDPHGAGTDDAGSGERARVRGEVREDRGAMLSSMQHARGAASAVIVAAAVPAALTLAPAEARSMQVTIETIAETPTYASTPACVAPPGNSLARREPSSSEATTLRPPRVPESFAQQRERAASSATVVVSPHSVAVVTRDSELSDAEALRDAFETAARLAGQRSALRSLTLNGRIVYEAPPPPHPVRAPLAFEC
jgi:hypothetical protein